MYVLTLWGDRDFSKALKNYFNTDVPNSAAAKSLNALLLIAASLGI
jgi:hypothetical protein